MKRPQPHKTKEIAIKYGVSAEVDCEIVPLVKWLNARRSVVTDTSCQGNSDEGKGSRPSEMECSAYVKFGVGDMKDLDLIARKIVEFSLLRTPWTGFTKAPCGVTFEFNYAASERVGEHWTSICEPKFTIRLDNKETMLLFTRYVVKKIKPPRRWQRR